MNSSVPGGVHPIHPVGTRVVARVPVHGSSGHTVHPAGAAGIVVRAPEDHRQAYRIRFLDGFEAILHHNEFVPLGEYEQAPLPNSSMHLDQPGMYGRVIYRCIVGSRAFGLDSADSDTDRRGIYLPPADLHWSLHGVPEQLENEATQEVYWELQKFLVPALKGNPNILECLYTPFVEQATPLARELLDMREAFLSKRVYQTYGGYATSQFERLQAALRRQGKVKPKQAMHLIRLLLSGIHVLREGVVPVDVREHRKALLSIKNGEMAWPEIDAWRLCLQDELDQAFASTKLPELPDYGRANQFLIRARRLAVGEELP